MGKSYNIGSKSDMRRFERDLKKRVTELAEESIRSGTYTANCPHCGEETEVTDGLNRCSHCHQQFKVTINVN